MDNLPGNPSNPNSGNNPPPPFGTNFNPHTNPPDPNNPYQSLPSQSSSIPSQPSYPPTPQTPSVELPNSPNYPNYPESPNNTHPSVHQEVAQHRLRDAHGQFLPYEHPTNPNPTASNPDTSVNLLNSPSPSNSPISSDTPKPESNFKRFIKFIVKIKWAKVSLYILLVL